MKVGILTFHHSLNAGAALQAWALQEYLRSVGIAAEIVNYGKIGWPSKYYLRMDSLRHFVGSFYNGFNAFRRTFLIETYRRHLYRRFQRACMGLGAEIAKADIPRLGYTHLITGSDQVWHPVINEGDETYFLANAAPGVKRISYAPSFGVDAFAPALERKMAGWLSQFDALSVREPQGAAIVKRLCGREATLVCDPTLLLPRTAYERIERPPRFGLPKRYIAVYTVCGHPWAEDAALRLGEQMNLPVVHLLGGQLARWYLPSKAKRITALGPSEWLWFIHHADSVVTNSFHGTVFSLVYHRPFAVALNGKASDARMQALLAGTGLESLATLEANEARGIASIDWQQVGRAIEAKASAGKAFLKGALA